MGSCSGCVLLRNKPLCNSVFQNNGHFIISSKMNCDLTGLSWEVLWLHVSAEVTQGPDWAGTFTMAQPDVAQLGAQLELLIRATPFSMCPVYGWLGFSISGSQLPRGNIQELIF